MSPPSVQDVTPRLQDIPGQTAAAWQSPKTCLPHLQKDTQDLLSPHVPVPRATHGGRTRRPPPRLSATAVGAAGFSMHRRRLYSSPA